jgi:hypothetical protein
LEQEPLFKRSYMTHWGIYSTGGPGLDYTYTFPPGTATSKTLADGAPITYTYLYDYTKAPYNYGYKYTYTSTQSGTATYRSIPGGAKFYNGASITGPLPLLTADHDPTNYYSGSGYVSYMMNADVFEQNIAVHTMGDGSSNTVLIGEGFSNCYGSSGGYRYAMYNPTQPSYGYSYSYSYEYTNGTRYDYAYNYSYTYLPRFGRTAGKTFQIRPTTYECDGNLLQGLSSGSVQILLGDASIRGVSQGMSTSTWHAAMTPSGNDQLGSDWAN